MSGNMKFVLFIYLFQGIILGDTTGGKVSDRKPQIVDGQEVTDIKKFPYIVGIFVENDQMKGSGVLVNENWVLTAASCVTSASDVTVMLSGLTTSLSTFAPPKITMDVSSSDIFEHPDFEEGSPTNDIALIKLPYSLSLKTAFLKDLKHNKDKKQLFVGASGVVTGYGKTTDQATTASATLQSISMSVISNDVCKTKQSGITASNICVESNENGPCGLDEGAPLIATGKDGKPTVIGVYAKSFATVDCTERNVSVFIRTSSYDKWISKTIASKK